ncbi:putative ABC transport system ATP-binding protein [Paenibacillus sophorae]|uniref:ABC transporter ATP-binding protein n=1 Tax=Paenibacillus sophorae TaxID=1333845 RepID=A0A1H8RUB6_9BACL|nr:ABC transporter ATP-binding protein [Paenibacillus sophorae]QWU16975.1 ABC transporter ATP-binding protein [Paenibacillus sophorae]SEO69935.1 putative ABC transport system ATP-binding protein [Paenibacillus sophorae]
MQSILELKNIEKYYGGKSSITKAIDDLSFTVAEGEFIGVMGPSGSGKTTLLNMIATIDHVSSGHIYIGGQDITEMRPKEIASFRRKNLGFVFQDFNLLDTLTVQENIALALTINRYSPKTIDELVTKIATKLGIEEILKKYPYEVSGGQKQRAACARAIITKPKLILADEPTGSLDSKSAQMLLEAISDLNQTMKATILMVTHDAFSASYCNRILVIKDGKIFTELIKGELTRKQFFNQILDTMALLGGDVRSVR